MQLYFQHVYLKNNTSEKIIIYIVGNKDERLNDWDSMFSILMSNIWVIFKNSNYANNIEVNKWLLNQIYADEHFYWALKEGVFWDLFVQFFFKYIENTTNDKELESICRELEKCQTVYSLMDYASKYISERNQGLKFWESFDVYLSKRRTKSKPDLQYLFSCMGSVQANTQKEKKLLSILNCKKWIYNYDYKKGDKTYAQQKTVWIISC